MKSIYAVNHLKIFDKILVSKRLEIANIINDYLSNKKIVSVLDIGTTEDLLNESSNIIIKNIKNIKIFRSISDQKIISNFFEKSLNKSIIENFSNKEVYEIFSDVSIANATLEHVGNENNQKKMIRNMIRLTKKISIIQTPNRFHPIDFHTKLPFIHWLPKKIHRFFLKIIGLNYLSKEENLNLLSYSDIKKILLSLNLEIKYNIKYLRFLGFKSNFIIFIEKI
jgi:hypothetical protein